MEAYKIEGTYGNLKTPCVVFVYKCKDGSCWYVCENSVNINKTYDRIGDNCNVEEIEDFDIITSTEPIISLNQLKRIIDEE